MLTFGLDYMRGRTCSATRTVGERDTGNSLDLREFKAAEYWLRLITAWPQKYGDQAVWLHLSAAGQREVLELAVQVRQQSKPDPMRGSQWRITTLRERIAAGDGFFQAVEAHLRDDDVRPRLLVDLLRIARTGLHDLTEGRAQEEDSLAHRMGQLAGAMRLSPLEAEIVLFFHLAKVSGSVGALSDIVRERDGKGRYLPGEMLSNAVLAALFGTTRQQVESALSKDGNLVRLGLVGDDGDLDPRVATYLDLGGSGSIFDAHFSEYRGGSLPLESHVVPREAAELLVEMLRAHDGSRPLHVLLHGIEGAGKTEFSRSVGSACGRKVIEVGGCPDSFQESGRGGNQMDSLVRHGLRSLHMASLHTSGSKAMLVVDESDCLLNHAEKGRLNLVMESLTVPVIWIANDITDVERSTLRRFDFSILFKEFGERQRSLMWERILEKHGAVGMLEARQQTTFSERYPSAAGGIDISVRNALALTRAQSFVPAAVAVEGLLKAHVRLLDLRDTSGERAIKAPSYSLEGLNVTGGVRQIVRAVTAFSEKLERGAYRSDVGNLTILLYGPPGTGKTEFARYLARELDRPLLLRSGGDFLNKYVGGTEANIRRAFDEAEETGGVLFIDEADGMLQTRERASHSWEVTQVNELLTRMERFSGILVCATNFEGTLDAASRRRFHFKLQFGYLTGDGPRHFWNVFFAGKTAHEPGAAFFRDLCTMPLLAPGDFKAVYERFRHFPALEVEPADVLEGLRAEVGFKDDRALRRLGL